MNLQDLGLSSGSSSDEEERKSITPSSPQKKVDSGGGDGEGDESDYKGSDGVGLENVPQPRIKAVEVSGDGG